MIARRGSVSAAVLLGTAQNAIWTETERCTALNARFLLKRRGPILRSAVLVISTHTIIPQAKDAILANHPFSSAPPAPSSPPPPSSSALPAPLPPKPSSPLTAHASPATPPHTSTNQPSPAISATLQSSTAPPAIQSNPPFNSNAPIHRSNIVPALQLIFILQQPHDGLRILREQNIELYHVQRLIGIRCYLSKL